VTAAAVALVLLVGPLLRPGQQAPVRGQQQQGQVQLPTPLGLREAVPRCHSRCTAAAMQLGCVWWAPVAAAAHTSRAKASSGQCTSSWSQARTSASSAGPPSMPSWSPGMLLPVIGLLQYLLLPLLLPLLLALFRRPRCPLAWRPTAAAAAH